MIRLLTHWYYDDNAVRSRELREAVMANKANPLATEIVVLDMSGGLDPLPFGTVPVQSRPTFTDYLRHGNSDPAWVNVLLNTDCYVRHEDAAFLERVGLDEVFCISRDDNPVEQSQDCWAWRGRLDVDAQFPLGVLGCDNRFAKLCQDAGRRVSNPCLSIRVAHVHASRVRRYCEQTRVKGEYLLVEPCAL